MIMRIWRGYEKSSEPGAYRRHLEGSVFPQLRSLPGFIGASLLRREAGGKAEVIVLTRWASMQAIEAFAGPEPGKAIVEPGARAVLESFDEVVTHHTVEAELMPSGTRSA
jgi:heme-degrading monooxygenase HmoA